MVKDTRILYVLLSGIVIIFFEICNDYINFIVFLLTICVVASFQQSLVANLVLSEHTSEKKTLKKLQKQMNEISVAQKHLDAYVEEL